MAIRFFIECEGEVVQLPVNPEKITVESVGDNTTEQIIKLGEINILRDRKLSSFNIECFFPLTVDAPYVLTKGQFKPPEFYISFFEKMQMNKKTGRLIITDTRINVPIAVESFEYTLQAGDDDYSYILTLKEYKYFSVKIAQLEPPSGENELPTLSAPTEQREPSTGEFAIGDSVIANGQYHYDSFGAAPFGTFNNFAGKISHIVTDSSRKYQYHITTPSGGYRGWVALSQISRA